MSTDWDRYSTAEDTRRLARRPEENGVIGLAVKSVREIGLSVQHSPEDSNRAHTNVRGEKTTEIRLKLMRIFRWMIDAPRSNARLGD